MKTLIAAIASMVLAASPALAQDKRKAVSKDQKGPAASKGQPSGASKKPDEKSFSLRGKKGV